MYHGSLITAQFLLAAAIVLSADWWPIPWSIVLLGAPGIFLAVWAWLTIGIRQIRIHPETTEHTRMMMSGPYRVVRHPMYSGLLWFSLVIVGTNLTLWGVVVWAALLAVLLAKINEEEKSLTSRFENYPAYKREVGKLVPRLYR